MLPDFANLDLANQPIWQGYYTLGLIEKYRPDIEMIDFRLRRRDQWRSSDHDIILLRDRIESSLHDGKKVLLVSWEEDIMGQQEDAITDTCNLYRDENFWFVSEMTPAGQDIFRRHHRFECKILELPFVITNDAIVYSKIRSKIKVPTPHITSNGYLCMIGRPEQHKSDLAMCLIEQGVGEYGTITMMACHDDHIRHVKSNPVHPRYQMEDLLTEHRKEAAQSQINGIWASSNVDNFLYIESTYDMPLIINPESTMGIFPATEKSIWPALLGRMYLILAQPGAMRYVQQFHDVDQSRWADLSFDEVGGWDHAAHLHRMNRMIQDNLDLIKNSRDIYTDLEQDLETARWSLAEQMYDFFKKQLEIL